MDIWYKLDCVTTSQRDRYVIFVKNMLQNPTVISNKLDFAFNEGGGRLYITNVTYVHHGLYLRENVCDEEAAFLYIGFKGMSF